MANYSNTVIYKIQHIDVPSLLYVGSTVAFRTRKSQHKSATNNPTNPQYKFKVYEMIRANGGWQMFNMVVIMEFPCKNKQDAHTEEDRIMREMKANMNMVKAYNSREDRLEHMKEYSKKYNGANKDKKKIYYKENRDKIKDYQKEYRKVNKDYQKIYRETNRDKIAEKRRLKAQANKLSKV